MEQENIMIDELALRIAETTKELFYWKSLYTITLKELEDLKESSLKESN